MKPTERFSSRASDYASYRPTYPDAFYAFLDDTAGVGPGTAIADIGAGTGILSEPLARRGAAVFAVEPNAAMRAEAEVRLNDCAGYTSVDGAAEATTLSDASVDLLLVGQAFHWFDPAAARAEALRILRPDGLAVLVWNNRKTAGTAFLEEYEQLLLTHGTDYADVSARYAEPTSLKTFFGAQPREKHFDNAQRFDWDGLVGRLDSSSYVPARDTGAYATLLRELRALFDRESSGGRIDFLYDTAAFYGPLASPAR